jgi:hypothetical protein
LPVIGGPGNRQETQPRWVILPCVRESKAFCLVVAPQHFILVGASHLPPTFAKTFQTFLA